MSDNLPPLPSWLDEFPHEHREWIIPRLQTYAREAASNEADDFQPVVEEVERLQKALAFWMPGVPGANHALHDRVAHDAYLLAGYDGPNNEPSAFELGHVSLSAIEAGRVGRDAPATWIATADQMPPPGIRVFWMNESSRQVGYDSWAGDDFRWTPSHWMHIPPLEAAPQQQPVEQPSEAYRAAVPAGWKLVPVEPTPEMIEAARTCHKGMMYPQDDTHGPSAMRRREFVAMLAASPQPQQVQVGDATGAVNETNAILASRYFDLLKVVEAYEAHGVTCQTFRHFVDQPCAECNCTTQPVQAQKEE